MKSVFLGNDACSNMLTYAISSKHINHAYLISGDKGLGKKTFAKLFAKSILCTSGQVKSCGDCNNCKNVEYNKHPDVYFLNYDNQTSLGIEKIRNIIKDIYIKPNQSDYKIYVICNIENMTLSAANALLKVLEEPPQHGIFIMTCQNIKSIPSTIVSRCVCLNVSPLDYENYELVLKKKSSLNSQDIRRHFLFFQGNVGKSLEATKNQNCFLEAIEFLKSISNQKEYEILLKLSLCENDKSKLMSLLENSYMMLRQILMLKLGKIEYEELFFSEMNYISNNLTLKQITKLIDLMIDREYLLNGNFNLSLILNVLCCEIKNILK